MVKRGGGTIKSNKKLRVNEEIDSSEVLLITSEGDKVGVVDKKVAISRAKEANLDLVEVSPQARPPVCKIMDYSRYYYEQKKKFKSGKKKSKSLHLKQIRLSPNIGSHDLEFKFGKIKQFLLNGHNVKINMMFKGRQREHQEMGKEILNSIINQLKDIATVQSEPNFEGFYMTLTMAPDIKND